MIVDFFLNKRIFLYNLDFFVKRVIMILWIVLILKKFNYYSIS